MPGNSNLGTLAEAAARCGVSPDTVRRRVRTGKLVGYRIGRRLRVDLDEAETAFRPVATVDTAEHIRRLVEAAPPLTPEQRAKITQLLAGDR